MIKFDLADLEESVAFFLQVAPSKPGAQDTFAMENRTYLLDALYEMDGRGKPDHQCITRTPGYTRST